jgi:hypothetical protein
MGRVARRLPAVLPGVLAALCLLLAGAALTEHRLWAAGAWALGAVLWAWQARRATNPAPPPPTHADEDWARRVLAAAGAPQGVRAVKALRDAEPGLSLLDAKQLADRVTAGC